MQNKWVMRVGVFISFIIVVFFMSLSTFPIKSTKQDIAHFIVIEAISDDPKAWDSLMNNTENLITAFAPESTKVEIVSHGNGLKMLLKQTHNTPLLRMQKLAEAGIVFAACQNTMKRMNLSVKDLIAFAIVVDSGIAEVIHKQEEGWSYISR